MSIYILTETIRLKNTGFETKTLWDWMDLLIIPFVLVLGAFLLNQSEQKIERKTAKKRIKKDQKLADTRAKLERGIAKDRQQEKALQAYLDRMSELLLDKDLQTTADKKVRDVARARTLSILRVLNTKRNDLIIQFLREAKLVTDENSILNNADMEKMKLQKLNFEKVVLQGTNLKKADLQEIFMFRVNLEKAELVGANLQKAFLLEANLQKVNLANANLKKAHLYGANLGGANLYEANLKRADLYGANLKRANLGMADLTKAHLATANLEKANLNGANLERADLQDAKVTETQLAEAKSLNGATMPDGTIHE